MKITDEMVKPLDLSNLLRHAFLAGRGLKEFDKLSEEDKAAWADYDPEKLPCFQRILSALAPAPAQEAGLVAKGLLSDKDAAAAGLARFGHHPDPAIDFCIEVEGLQGRLFNAEHGISKPGEAAETVASVLEDIQRAMTFRVGGDEGAVAAKAYLRKMEAEAIATAPAPAQEAVERVTWRYETEAEHAARDMREGRFPERSAVEMVPVPAQEAGAVGYQHTLDTAMFITPEEYADTKNQNNFRPVFASPPAQEAGAVAWRTGDDEGGWAYTRDREEAERWVAKDDTVEHLYTFPPAQRGEWAEEIVAKLSPPLRPEIVRAALSGYRILAPAPAQEAVAEPVVWRWSRTPTEWSPRFAWRYGEQRPADEDAHIIDGWTIQPLYASPPSLDRCGEWDKAARLQYERYVSDVRDLEPAWDDLPKSHRDRMVDSLRAALSVLS